MSDLGKSEEGTQPSSKSSGSISKPVGIVLIIVIIVSLLVAGYSSLNPNVTDVTQQQFITQTVSNMFTVTTNKMMTTVAVVTSTQLSAFVSPPPNPAICGPNGCPYSGYSTNCGQSTCAYPICGSNGCSFQLCGATGGCSISPGYTPSYTNCGYNGCPYTTCQPAADNAVQCAGYLYQNSDRCVELAVPVADYAIGASPTSATQYYTLHNLPSTYPAIGSWVTIKGQMNLVAPNTINGAACPGNYINVNVIS